MSPTPPTTDNHALPLIPHVGDANASDYTDQWGAILNDSGWSVLDKRLIARDTESNRTNYTPYQNALFRATDSGAWYVGDGSTWTLANSTVSALTADNASLGSASLSGSLTTDSGTTIWDSSNAHVPLAQLEADSITVAGNNISLGGSSTLAHGDLTNISSSDHHEWPVSNSNLVNNAISIAGTSVSLGGSVSLGHSDLTNESISASDHHEWPITNSNLNNSTVTVAGHTVSLGGSTTIAHGDLTTISNSDHHEWPVSNSNLSNSSITVAGTNVALGGSVSLGHGDLTSTSISASNHHEWPVSNSNLSNSSVTVGGNTVSLGGSTSIDHADLSSIGANDHHTAHEHPGDQAATSNINVNGNGITNVATINGTYAKHDFTGSTYNIDLVDSTADARFRNTANNTIIWFRESRNVEIPAGSLSIQGETAATQTWVGDQVTTAATSLSDLDTQVSINSSDISSLQSDKLDSSNYNPESDTHDKYEDSAAISAVETTDLAGISFTDGNGTTYGRDGDFSITYDNSGDALVVRDESNGVDLIRQPKAGPTTFVQGIDAGPIAAPADSYSQLANEIVTDSLASGDQVGYTFALDNQTALAIEGEADGSGGTQNEVTRIPNSTLEVGGNSGGDVEISGELTENASL